MKRLPFALLLAFAGCHTAPHPGAPPAVVAAPPPGPAAAVEVFKGDHLPDGGCEVLSTLSVIARPEEAPGVEAYFVQCAMNLGGNGVVVETLPVGTAGKVSCKGTVVFVPAPPPQPPSFRNAEGLVVSGVRPAHPVTTFAKIGGQIIATTSPASGQEVRDPLEDLPQFRAAFDEASQLAEEKARLYRAARGPLGAIHIYWAEKQRVLREKYGLGWKTPGELNPSVNYD